MIQTGFDSRVKIQQIVEGQLPSFILDESPNASEFLKQYYISQEYQSGPVDLADNLDQYLKVDNLVPEVIVDSTTLSSDITITDTIVTVSSTKGFPNEYGLLKIDNEIITYTGLTTNTFTGCIRGFSGVTDYKNNIGQGEIIFSESDADAHSSGTSIQNLSSLFLKEFYKKIKSTFTPGFEELTFAKKIDAGNFIRRARDFYQAKGTNESIRILFNVLYGETPRVINLEDYLIKPSDASYIRREIVIVESLTPGSNPLNIEGQTIVKNTDPDTNAAVSSVEIFERGGDILYKLELFIGYDGISSVQGDFTITPNSKVLDNVSIGSSIINVDSTIGFDESGVIFYNEDRIPYTSKSVNQFFGCSGIVTSIPIGESIRSNDTYFSYENGDLSKVIDFRILGILSSDIKEFNNSFAQEDELLKVKNLGRKINNNSKNELEIFANSWIYNTSTRNEISNSNVLTSPIDRSSLKVGDELKYLERGGKVELPSSNTFISGVDITSNQLTIENKPTIEPDQKYDIRRKVNRASSDGTAIEFGNSQVISDVLNIYTDNDYYYVSSNSLPSEVKSGITTTSYRLNIQENIKEVGIDTTDNLGGLTNSFYSIIKSDTDIPFITGDRIFYQPQSIPFAGLETGSYYVEILENPKQFKLFASPAFIGSSNNLEFIPDENNFGEHTFTLITQKDREIGAQTLLRRFPLEKNIQRSGEEETVPGTTGMLINGVEIHNYKSNDKIYYGPISKASVLSSGQNYDVINPPHISVSTGAGTTAKIQPVVSGKFEKVFIDKQDFDLDQIVSINISGGNGLGAVLEPIIKRESRSVIFDASRSVVGGGINTSLNIIQFTTDHNFLNGEEIVYNSNGNEEIQLEGSLTLENNASYYAEVINNKSIKIYNSLSDQQSGINEINIDGASSGFQNFRTASTKKKISYIKVLNGGSGYTNRKLIVNPSGISTTNSIIKFENHGFKNGELITYTYDSSSIGINSENQYYVLEVDSDRFRICDAGIGGTNKTNFDRQNYVSFASSGSGYQYFNYPSISVSIDYTLAGLGTTSQTKQSLVATPSVRGSIIDAYVYENGTGYGSTILNYQNRPTYEIKTGKRASASPIVINGQINSIIVPNNGEEYFSTPDIVINGEGTGAEARAIIDTTTQKLTEIKVVNSGLGYTFGTTTIDVISSGSNAVLELDVRPLTINDNNFRFTNGEVIQESNNKLQYSVSSYFENLRTSFNENGSISGLIGWAYDGNPIYGHISHSDPNSLTSSIKTLQSGYKANISNIDDRPVGFSSGFFVEDYKFENSGDLDEYNGRFEKTVEFPNGRYVYHATIDSTTNLPSFPYFIGNKYYSKTVKDDNLNQSFNFNNSNLQRNTFPYKVAENGSTYEFFNLDINEARNQRSTVESISSGVVESFIIESPGNDYKVGDSLIFDDKDTSGSGLNVEVGSISGKKITSIESTELNYFDSIFTWKSSNEVKVSILPNHNLKNSDYVNISGFSTNLTELNGTFQITTPSYPTARCLSSITSASAGFTTEIYVSSIPDVSIGSSIIIDSEYLKILDIYKNDNILRIERGSSGVSHTVGTAVTFVPDSFTISKSLNKFDSKIQKKVFFNPKESLGIGTISGIGTSVTFNFGNITITRDIPTQKIYLENNPFTSNEEITYTSTGSLIQVSTDGSNTSNLVSGTNLFVVRKNNNLIGLKTSISGSELFFHTNGDDVDNQYQFESNYSQILGDVQKITSTISVSTPHNLNQGDIVTLDVKSGLSTEVSVIYKSYINNIVINPITFNSTGVNTTTNEITIPNHNLETGNKVFYEDSTNSAVNNNSYYIYKVNQNKIKLCETYIDSQKNPPTVVSFGSTGGSSQELSLINPRLNPIKNNDLTFDLSDSSLTGYNFKIYYDNDFNNEFVSTGSTSSFVVSTGSSSLTINYNNDIPEVLYYTLESNGKALNSDFDVKDYSQIKYTNSIYNNSYEVIGIAETTFNVNLIKSSEKSSYISSESDVLEYSTTSLTASGPVKTLRKISSGQNYKKLPILDSVKTDAGSNLVVSLKSKSVGKIQSIKIINNKYEYSSDNTLRPSADISPILKVKDSNTIGIISVTDGGTGYVSPPDIGIADLKTGEKIDSGFLEANLSGSAISSINIVKLPTGLPDSGTKIFAANNSNGVTIREVESSNTGIFTCLIQTPILGFPTTGIATQPVDIGDEVFIEGIQKLGTGGDGFNSEDYGYAFFPVINYTKGINDKVTIDISNLTSNTGIAVTIQDGTGSLINKDKYPTFLVIQENKSFFIGEKIISNNIIRDLEVIESSGTSLKLLGTYELSLNEVITGKNSGNTATISLIEDNSGIYQVNYSNKKNIGWETDTGKLSEDFQVTPNNDYYQNLSYSIQSSKTYIEQDSPVNSLVHISGMRNFADTGITSSVSAGIDTNIPPESATTILVSLVDEKRVDTINNLDLVTDVDVVNSTSKYIRFENLKLTDSVELISNDVLRIDDISSLFSNSESETTTFTDLINFDNQKYQRFIFRITSENRLEIQLIEIIILNDDGSFYIVEKSSLSNTNNPKGYGDIDIVEDEFGSSSLRFNPEDKFNTNYDIKFIGENIITQTSGIGTTESIGFIDLSSYDNTITGLASTTIVELDSDKFKSLYVNTIVTNDVTKELNFVRLYVSHNDTDTFISEYYTDTSSFSSFAGNQIGSFGSNLTGGLLTLSFENDISSDVSIETQIVGFGTTAVGVGTYRFIIDGQIPGNERSAVYESKFYSTFSATPITVLSLDQNLFNASKALIEIGIGTSKALHEIYAIHDSSDSYILQGPFLSINDFTGIGTFGANLTAGNFIITFYPDASQTGNIDVSVFSKSLYTALDNLNDPDPLKYGIISEEIDYRFYNAPNLSRINRKNFTPNINNVPIFKKTFNPSDTSVLNSETGIFTISNHFFRTGEKLTYIPKSTFVGIGTSAMKYTSSDELPSEVYAIKVDENNFKIAVSESDANNGTGVTFSSVGEGNAHSFSMTNENSKAIITIDDLVQYPIAFTKVSHTLDGNDSGGIGIANTFISLSGISTVNPLDFLRIDDEYVRVLNVGLGTTASGPITNSGSLNLVEVERGSVGSSPSSHTDSTVARVYKGAYNITDGEIVFADAPRGNPQITKTKYNLDFETSSFTGRVFLRSDYTTNKVYDDISDEFTGIGRTFNLKVGGANTTGIGTIGGSGLVFINSIYQSPVTDNNPLLRDSNYTIIEDTTVGITTLIFSGITVPDTDPLEYISDDTDVNVNETPRGGIIVSLGSSSGRGFAPLVGASVTATTTGGAITGINTDFEGGTYGSGYNGIGGIGVTVFESGHTGNTALISATVGVGGSVILSIDDPGSGYNNPEVFISDPSYSNLEVIGVSRLSLGSTTESGIGLLVDLEVGPEVGIGSTLFTVSDFRISRNGYSFRKGDVIKPVGLVTAAGLSAPIEEFTLTVLETFQDSFSAWEFGELDYIDSIKNYQNGTRTRFPLFYNGEILSIENPNENIDIKSTLLIFINGILQDPGVSYDFKGGTSFIFTTAPLPEDNIEIYFYRGVDGTDAILSTGVDEIIQRGDKVQIIKNNEYPDIPTQDIRTVFDVSFSDKIETQSYTNQGIDEINPRPISLIKQKTDKFINGELVYKTRDSIEGLVFPVARIIGDLSTTDNQIFVDNTSLFEYEDETPGFTNPSTPFDAIVVDGISTTSSGSVENIKTFVNVIGFSGIVTGITTSAGTGSNPLAIVFNIYSDSFTGLSTGYPIYIFDTSTIDGVTSIYNSDSEIVGIGTTFADCVYNISDWSVDSTGFIGILTCNVKSDTNVIGIDTSGSVNNPVGRYSWGRLSNLTSGLGRSNPIAIGVSGKTVSGLSSYPIIQRRSVGIRTTGALPKIVV